MGLLMSKWYVLILCNCSTVQYILRCVLLICHLPGVSDIDPCSSFSSREEIVPFPTTQAKVPLWFWIVLAGVMILYKAVTVGREITSFCTLLEPRVVQATIWKEVICQRHKRYYFQKRKIGYWVANNNKRPIQGISCLILGNEFQFQNIKWKL